MWNFKWYDASSEIGNDKTNSCVPDKAINRTGKEWDS